MPVETTARASALRLKEISRGRVQVIERDPTLTKEWKERLLAREHRDVQKQLDGLHREHDDYIVQRKQDLQQRVFSFPDDPDAYREALDRVSALETPDKLARRLRLAQRAGDAVTAHAIFAVASERSGCAEIVDSHLAAHPEVKEHRDRLQLFEADAGDFNERLFSPFRNNRPGALPKNANINHLADEADRLGTAGAAASAGF